MPASSSHVRCLTFPLKTTREPFESCDAAAAATPPNETTSRPERVALSSGSLQSRPLTTTRLILGTGEDYAQLLLPQHKVAFTQQTSEFEASRIEVEVAELDDDDFAAWDLEKEGDPQFEVTDLNEVGSDYSTNVSGNVMNDFTKKTEIRVVVCMRDASGALVDGAQAYVTDVPASDSTSFTAYMPRKAVEHATLEGYSNPSVPMS